MSATAGIQISAEALAGIAGTKNATTVPALLADARNGLADSNLKATHEAGMDARGEFKGVIEALGVVPQSTPGGRCRPEAEGQDQHSNLHVLRRAAEASPLKTSGGGAIAPKARARVPQSAGTERRLADSRQVLRSSMGAGAPAGKENEAAREKTSEIGIAALPVAVAIPVEKQNCSWSTLEAGGSTMNSLAAGVSTDAVHGRRAMSEIVPSAASGAPDIALRDGKAARAAAIEDSAPAPAAKEEVQTTVTLFRGADEALQSATNSAAPPGPENGLAAGAIRSGPDREPDAAAVTVPVGDATPFPNDRGMAPRSSARISEIPRAGGRTVEQGAKVSHARYASSDAANQVRRIDSAEVIPLNAPPLRELSGYGNSGEKQAVSQHAASTAADPFSALDGERANPPGTWIHAGAHHAEAGYLDPALGWVRVRADSTDGAVHAALVPGSAEAAQVLGGHVAGLNAYLSEHHAERASVTMAAPQDETGMSMGRDSGDRPPAQQQEQSRSSRRLDDMQAPQEVRAPAAIGLTETSASRNGAAGKTISVMA